MDRCKKIHRKMFERMLESSKSIRKRCLIGRSKDRRIALDACFILQPFEIAKTSEMSVWESESLELILHESPIDPKFDYEQLLTSSEIKVGGHNLEIVGEYDNQQIRSDIIYGGSWLKRYSVESKGVLIERKAKLDRELTHELNEKFQSEIRHHPRSPFHTPNDFSINLLGTNKNLVENYVFEIVTPYWAYISEVIPDGMNIITRVKASPTLFKDITMWYSIQFPNGTLVEKSVKLILDSRKQASKRLTDYEGRYTLPKKYADATKVTVTLNLDDKFSIASKQIDFSPSKILLYPLLSKINTEKGGQFDEFLQGKNGKISVDGFEWAVSALLSSFDFKVINIGPIGQAGLDLIAIASGDDRIMLVECGRKKPRQKASDCARNLEKLRRLYPQYKFRGVIACAEKIPPHDRKDIVTSEIGILDIDDIQQLRNMALHEHDASIVLERIDKSRYIGVDF